MDRDERAMPRVHVLKTAARPGGQHVQGAHPDRPGAAARAGGL